jgi:hypothetical protein
MLERLLNLDLVPMLPWEDNRQRAVAMERTPRSHNSLRMERIHPSSLKDMPRQLLQASHR